MSTSTAYHRRRFAGMAGRPLHADERRILALVADGCTDRQIADRLGVTYETVKWVQREIRAKLGARDRAHTVHRAWQAGYLGGGR